MEDKTYQYMMDIVNSNFEMIEDGANNTKYLFRINYPKEVIKHETYSIATTQDIVRTLVRAVLAERRRAYEKILPKVEKFIEKVETDRAKSKETYKDMIEIRDYLKRDY